MGRLGCNGITRWFTPPFFALTIVRVRCSQSAKKGTEKGDGFIIDVVVKNYRTSLLGVL